MKTHIALAEQSLMAERLEAALALSRSEQRSSHVFLTIDLDGFTGIASSFGSAAAARLLEAIGTRLAGCIQSTDTIARYGCDEFAVLVRCSSCASLADVVTEAMQSQLATPFTVEGQQIAVTASVGIVRVSPDHASAADVRRDADAAVHHAKLYGGNRCVLFDEGMHEKTRTKLQLEAELRNALEREEFRLYYQPIVHAGPQTVAALEALLRWEHPARGCLPPSEFLDSLASAGLMTEVGRWIVGEACRQTVEWHHKGVLEGAAISINVSPRQLLEPGFVPDLARTLESCGADPSWIEIEITEDLSLGDGEAAIATLQSLRELGIRVHIDDFGTGYSSLSYLQRLPVSGLKIDRVFLDSIETDAHRREIVGAIIRLAHVLGLDVVAEGVERQEQLDAVLALECDYVQGYHISKPLPASQIPAWMAGRA